MLASTITSIMDQINTLEYLPKQNYTPMTPDPTTVVPANRRAPPLDSGQSTKIGGRWDLKHDIISPIFYELLIKTELKRDTNMDLKNFYNHIKMCLNVVKRLQ